MSELTYTTDRPTEPGWYWVRSTNSSGDGTEEWLTHLTETDSGLSTYDESEAEFTPIDEWFFHKDSKFFQPYEWGGPIPRPNEPEIPVVRKLGIPECGELP